MMITAHIVETERQRMQARLAEIESADAACSCGRRHHLADEGEALRRILDADRSAAAMRKSTP